MAAPRVLRFLSGLLLVLCLSVATAVPSTPSSTSLTTTPNSNGTLNAEQVVFADCGCADVFIALPNLRFDHLLVDLDYLLARLDLYAQVSGLLSVEVGAVVGLREVELEVRGLHLGVELEIRLLRLVGVLDQAFDLLPHIDPALISSKTAGVVNTLQGINAATRPAGSEGKSSIGSSLNADAEAAGKIVGSATSALKGQGGKLVDSATNTLVGEKGKLMDSAANTLLGGKGKDVLSNLVRRRDEHTQERERALDQSRRSAAIARADQDSGQDDDDHHHEEEGDHHSTRPDTETNPTAVPGPGDTATATPTASPTASPTEWSRHAREAIARSQYTAELVKAKREAQLAAASEKGEEPTTGVNDFLARTAKLQRLVEKQEAEAKEKIAKEKAAEEEEKAVKERKKNKKGRKKKPSGDADRDEEEMVVRKKAPKKKPTVVDSEDGLQKAQAPPKETDLAIVGYSKDKDGNPIPLYKQELNKDGNLVLHIMHKGRMVEVTYNPEGVLLDAKPVA